MSAWAWPHFFKIYPTERLVVVDEKESTCMNDTQKIAWIDEANRILSFHAIDSGKVIQETESLFWDFVRGLMSAGYRIM